MAESQADMARIAKALEGSHFVIHDDTPPACGEHLTISRPAALHLAALIAGPRSRPGACGCPTGGLGYRHHRMPCSRAGENEPITRPVISDGGEDRD